MIVRTEAVTLRTFRYGETSLIASLFTRYAGRVSVLARGARGPKSRFGASLQPMTYVEALYSHKPTRSLQTLREASHVIRFPHLSTDLTRLTPALRMVELTSALTEEGEPNVPLFNLLTESLQGANAAPGRPENALYYFEMRLAALLGFSPQFAKSDVEAVTDEGGALTLTTGDIEAHAATRVAEQSERYGVGRQRIASRSVLRAFAVATRASLRDVLRLRLTDDESRELSDLIEAYLRFHVDDAYPSRSDEVRSALRAGALPALS
jgi:DNA repair protein RecO (recombination protein O)